MMNMRKTGFVISCMFRDLAELCPAGRRVLHQDMINTTIHKSIFIGIMRRSILLDYEYEKFFYNFVFSISDSLGVTGSGKGIQS